MPFIGADIDELRRLAVVFQRSGRRISETTQVIAAQLGRSTWTGHDADHFQEAWAQIRAQLLRVDDQFAELAQVIDRQADEQERASAGSDPGRLGNRMYGFGSRQGPQPQGRMTVLSAIMDLDNPDRIGPGQIGIRQLDNGNYVVILPGVEDLSSSLDNFGQGAAVGAPFGAGPAAVTGTEAVIDEIMDPSGSIRDMRYAIPASMGGSNAYADAVRAAMQDAGIPAGANVMVVGHSYGAYAAVDLASDSSFNNTNGPGYYVNITHAVAIGADTDWDAGDIPPGTNLLIANNRFDAAYQAEVPLHHGVYTDLPDNVTRIDFNGGNAGWGHDPQNYSDWFATAEDRDNLKSFWNSVGDNYAGPGYQRTVGVSD